MKKIAVLSGDGIGPEVMEEALRVLSVISSKYKIDLEFNSGLIGGAAYDQYQQHFPDETREICKQSNAILFGSVGGPVAQATLPKWHNCERNSILALRKEFSFYANLRSLKVPAYLAELSPIKSERVKNGLDILVIRELIGDVYFGEHSINGFSPNRIARDIAEYTEPQIRDIAHVAFKTARTRDRKLVSVDKANVLDISRLWRDVMHDVHKEYSDVELEDMLVDNCAMQIVRHPNYFSTIVTSNLFGDILSDLVSVLGGSLGLMPSASLAHGSFGMYEPAGGSAPDIAGKGIANPIAQILSAALMLRYSFDLEEMARKIEEGVAKAVGAGARTADLVLPGESAVSTKEIVDEVLKNI